MRLNERGAGSAGASLLSTLPGPWAGPALLQCRSCGGTLLPPHRGE